MYIQKLGDPFTISLQSQSGVIANSPPTANAGPDQSGIIAGATVTLDFSGSTDGDGTIATYAVTQTAGDTVTLSGTGNSRTFTAPSTGSPQTLTFSLVVTDDDDQDSEPDTVNIGILAEVVSPTTSTAVITIVGISDGPHDIKLWSEVTDTILYDGSVTFSSDIGNATVTADVGTAFTGRWLGNDPPTTGTGVYGVTE